MEKKPRSSEITKRHADFFKLLLSLVERLEPEIENLLKAWGKGGMPANLSWHEHYKEPFSKFLMPDDASQADIAEFVALVKEARKVARPKRQAAKAFQKLEEEFPRKQLPELIEWIKEFLGAMIALRNNLQCIAIHSISLNKLIELAKKGNQQAFFDAIRLDKSLVSASFFADRISLAYLRNEKPFLTKLSQALNPALQAARNIDTNISPLKLLMAAIYEFSDLQLSTKSLMQLLNDVGFTRYKDPESFRKAMSRVRYKDIGTSTPVLPVTE